MLVFIIAFILLVPFNCTAALIFRPRGSLGNEICGVATCRSYATAQDMYFRRNLSRKAPPEYALTLEDLYEYTPGAGDLVLIDRSFRNAEAFRPTPKPKCGYLFKVLTSQGGHARGGTLDYLDNGHMLHGYALIAFPAVYDESSVRTSFTVNQEGEIFEGDLGPDTTKIVQAMTTFDPDPKIWTVAE